MLGDANKQNPGVYDRYTGRLMYGPQQTDDFYAIMPNLWQI